MSIALIEPEPVRGHNGLALVAGPITSAPFGPKPDDVVQGDIAACPIAAVMVAMAHARSSAVSRMLGAALQGPALSKRRGMQVFDLWSAFYYDVVFRGRGSPTRISPMIYMDDGDVKYAGTPSRAGWPSYIEKAYAVWKSKGGQGGSGGNYSRIALNQTITGPPDLTEVMTDLIGKVEVLDFARGLFIDSGRNARDPKAGDVAAMAKRSAKRPTVAPTNPAGAEKFNLISNHGDAVLGFRSGVRLRNPWGGSGANITVSLKDFNQASQGIWQAVWSRGSSHA